MGCLYTGSGTFTLNPERTLATFESGTVYSPAGALSTGHKVLMHYDGGRIYRYVDEAIVGSPVILARCDEFGRIKSEAGALLGHCEGGKIKDSAGQVIGYYDGDMYGAAAAACAVLFDVSGRSKEENTGKDTDDKKCESFGKGNGSDGSTLELIFSIIGLALLSAGKFLWKLIKTAYLWGPYVFTLVLSAIVVAPAAMIILLPILVYLALHTVLLLKCRKREGKGKYRPAVISFLIYLISFFLLGIPAIVYQVVWLVRDQKKKQIGGNET